MVCGTLGRPVRFVIALRQSHDILAFPALLEGYRLAAVFADRAYNANSLRAYLVGIGAEAVIPSTRSRKTPDPARSPDLQAAQSRRALLHRPRSISEEKLACCGHRLSPPRISANRHCYGLSMRSLVRLETWNLKGSWSHSTTSARRLFVT
ncbi:hypothetical protein [Brevundimonas diminuta]|uniref:hypothetical protein n=1 Tax=Brevundimonas diminuta TaxID=293 RepID=UPI00397B3527